MLVIPFLFSRRTSLPVNTLCQVADYLNLNLGIVHGDICPFTLLINAETDSIQLVDFKNAAKLGWEGDLANGTKFEYNETATMSNSSSLPSTRLLPANSNSSANSIPTS